MPELVRLYIRSVLIGILLSLVFSGAIIFFDVVGMRNLMLLTSGGWLAAFLLVFFNAILFAGVQFAFAVMSLADGGNGGGLRNRIAARLRDPRIPAPAVSRARPHD